MLFPAALEDADISQVDVMLTGTWLESEKLLAGLFFLLLLLLLLPPPELTVLPPDTFLFRRLLGACLAGSAIGRGKKKFIIVNFSINLYKSVVSSPVAGKVRSYNSNWVCLQVLLSLMNVMATLS